MSKSIIKQMKAHVYVTLKRTVLDAQGKTVADALTRMNYAGVSDVRQGKYFVLTLADAAEGQSAEAHLAAAQAEVERIAKEVLVNPVIEEYTLRLEPVTVAGMMVSCPMITRSVVVGMLIARLSKLQMNFPTINGSLHSR